MVYFWAFFMLATWIASAAVLTDPSRLQALFRSRPATRSDARWISVAIALPATIVWFVAFVNSMPLPPPASTPAPAPQPLTSAPKAPEPIKAPEKTRLAPGDLVRFPQGLLTCDDPDVFLAFAQAAARNDEAAAWAAAASPYGSRCSVLSPDDTFKIREVHYADKRMPDSASVAVVPPDVAIDWPAVYGAVVDRSFWRIVGDAKGGRSRPS